MTNLPPTAQDLPVKKLASGDPNSAALLNPTAQGFLNQAEAIAQELGAIAATQATIEQRLTQLAGAQALRNNAIALQGAIASEQQQIVAADVQASAIENGLPALNSALQVEGDRVTPTNNKLNSITTTTYQAYSAVLQAIAAAPLTASKYLYSNAGGAIAWENPQLSSGTRIRDLILRASIASGGTAPTIANATWTNIPMVQAINMGSDRMAWNAATRTLTLQPGEYLIEGYVCARGALVQMCLQQVSGTTYLGTTGKGTTEGAIVPTNESLSIYSFLIDSFLVSSARSYNPQIFLSGGAIPVGTLGKPTPWAFLRVRHFLY